MLNGGSSSGTTSIGRSLDAVHRGVVQDVVLDSAHSSAEERARRIAEELI